jgi:hypothetical protein
MRLQLLSLLCFSLLRTATAQQIRPLRVETDSISFLVAIKDMHMFLELTSPLEGITLRKSISAITQISLSDADLVISYTPAAQSRDITNQMECRLTDRSGNTIVPDQYSTKTAIDEKGEHRFTWMDAVETPLVFGREYVLHIKVSLLGPIDCSAERPAFTLKQQLPYYAVGIAGLSAIGVGYGLNVQKKNAYRQYSDKWANGATENAAQEDFKSAEKKQRQATALIYSGLAVIAIDALLWSMRSANTKRDQRRFDRYCVQPAGMGFMPARDATPMRDMASPDFGIQLTYRF